MARIHVEDRNGKKRDITFETGSGVLMEQLVEEGFDVPAICGGMAGCGTCHITVLKGGENLDKPEEDEAFMLDSLPNVEKGSRLSCQLPMNDALDGLEIKILGDGM